METKHKKKLMKEKRDQNFCEDECNDNDLFDKPAEGKRFDIQTLNSAGLFDLSKQPERFKNKKLWLER